MSEYFPTEFAINIAREVNLHTREHVSINFIDSEWVKQWTRLGEAELDKHILLEQFQNVSLCMPFKECLNTYVGIKLSKKQKKALKIIHRATPLWFKGVLIREVIEMDKTEYLSIDRLKMAFKLMGM